MVAQFDQHPVLTAFGGNVHVGDAGVLCLAVAPRVFEQVGDHAGQFHFVGQHVEVFGHGHRDLQFAMVLHRIDAGRHHGMQVDRCQRDMVRPSVVEELVDRGVELHDVCHHVLAGHFIGHAHLGFQPQACERRAQVVRNARQHHGAVLLQLGQFLRHAVEADVHFADFAGHYFLVEVARCEVAVLDAVGRVGELLERPVDQPRNGRRTGQGQRPCRDQPDQPGTAARRAEARAVHQQPVGVAIDVEADPQAGFPIHVLRHDGVGPQALGEFVGQAVAQGRALQKLELVARLARQDAHAFLVGHGLDERHTSNGVGMHQRRAAQVHQRCDLLRGVQGARLELQRPQGLQPRQNAPHQQQRQQEESAPEEIEAHTRPLLPGLSQGLQGGGAGGVGGSGHGLPDR